MAASISTEGGFRMTSRANLFDGIPDLNVTNVN